MSRVGDSFDSPSVHHYNAGNACGKWAITVDVYCRLCLPNRQPFFSQRPESPQLRCGDRQIPAALALERKRLLLRHPLWMVRGDWAFTPNVSSDLLKAEGIWAANFISAFGVLYVEIQ